MHQRICMDTLNCYCSVNGYIFIDRVQPGTFKHKKTTKHLTAQEGLQHRCT